MLFQPRTAAVLAISIAAVAMPAKAVAAPAAVQLSLLQAAGSGSTLKLPVCSSKTTTACRKKGANNTWIIVGAVAAVAVAVSAASVSP